MLSGKHVFLRAIERDDLEQLRIWRNDPELRQYFREYQEINSEQQDKWYVDYVLPRKNTLMFSIVDHTSHKLLGACGLCYIDWLRRSADFSIYIGHKGLYLDTKFAPDAAAVLESYAFDELGLHRLWAEVYAIDSKKQQFFKALKFREEGRFLDSHWTKGKWVDSIYFGKLSKK